MAYRDLEKRRALMRKRYADPVIKARVNAQRLDESSRSKIEPLHLNV